MKKQRKIDKDDIARARNFLPPADGSPLVVGTVHSPGGLRLATRLGPGAVDLLEFRLDALAGHFAAMERALLAVKLPVLLTVRHPAEGGLGGLPSRIRRELYLRYLPFAALVDVELRSLPAFSDVLDAARALGVARVVSSHDFARTPPLATLLARQKRAFAAGADIFKLACATPGPRELARLLEFIARPAPGARSAMGMGALGPASRLALARSGSLLNYGYLDTPNAPGQWEARELRALVES